jgi:hypothetical protein
MKTILLAIPLLMLVVTLAGDDERKWANLLTSSVRPTKPIPKEVKEILKGLDVRSHQIDLKEFEETSIKDLTKRIPEDYVVCHLPDNPSIADEFIYTIVKEKESGKFWIVKLGGFAGVSKVYRPKTQPAAVVNARAAAGKPENHLHD